jgi:hypothetical protein
MIRDGAESCRLVANPVKAFNSRRMPRLSQLLGFFQAYLGNHGPLSLSLVGASGLAKVSIGSRHVKNVVNNLEENAQLPGESSDRGSTF